VIGRDLVRRLLGLLLLITLLPSIGRIVGNVVQQVFSEYEIPVLTAPVSSLLWLAGMLLFVLGLLSRFVEGGKGTADRQRRYVERVRSRRTVRHPAEHIPSDTLLLTREGEDDDPALEFEDVQR
jgi:hypothetical protein